MAQSSETVAQPAVAAADATSIIVVDERPEEKSLSDFFSFRSPGGFTWWAGVILGILGCCAFASMIIIQSKTNRREPPPVMALMREQQCPFLSTKLPVLAFEAWLDTCPSASKGSPYTCTTQSDCTRLDSRCADERLLAQLQCVDTGVRSDKARVCAYPSANVTTASTTAAAASPGFCTQAGTTCALCLGGACETTSPSFGSIGCPSSSACSSGSWMCNPLS